MSNRLPRSEGPDGPVRPGSVLYRLIARVAGRIASTITPTGRGADDHDGPPDAANEVPDDDRS